MHVQGSFAKAKGKQQNFVISVTMAILIGCFTRTFFRESNSILLAKANDSHLRNHLEVHSLSLLLNFITRKSLC